MDSQATTSHINGFFYSLATTSYINGFLDTLATTSYINNLIHHLMLATTSPRTITITGSSSPPARVGCRRQLKVAEPRVLGLEGRLLPSRGCWLINSSWGARFFCCWWLYRCSYITFISSTIVLLPLSKTLGLGCTVPKNQWICSCLLSP